MKKIEQKICKTFDSMKHKMLDSKANLSSRDTIEHDYLATDYYLHDELIVQYIPALYKFRFSLRGYNTVTTRSRLRAFLRFFCLAQQLYMKQGTVYLETFDGEKHVIDPNRVYTIKNNDLIKE